MLLGSVQKAICNQWCRCVCFSVAAYIWTFVERCHACPLTRNARTLWALCSRLEYKQKHNARCAIESAEGKCWRLWCYYSLQPAMNCGFYVHSGPLRTANEMKPSHNGINVFNVIIFLRFEFRATDCICSLAHNALWWMGRTRVWFECVNPIWIIKIFGTRCEWIAIIKPPSEISCCQNVVRNVHV